MADFRKYSIAGGPPRPSNPNKSKRGEAGNPRFRRMILSISKAAITNHIYQTAIISRITQGVKKWRVTQSVTLLGVTTRLDYMQRAI